MLAFPTSPSRASKPGFPIRAHSCHCTAGPMIIVGEDTCLRCGHHTHQTITRTWTTRARLLAERSTSKRRAAA